MLLLLRVALVAAVLGIWIYAVLDVIRTEADRIPYMHKMVWLLLVLLFNPIGPIAWLVLGRPETQASASPPAPPSIAPDDSPDYLRKLDEELRRRRKAEDIRGQLEAGDVDAEIEGLEEQFPPDDPEVDRPS